MISLLHHKDRISLYDTVFFFSHPTNPQNAISGAVFLLPSVGKNNPSELRSTKLPTSQGSVGALGQFSWIHLHLFQMAGGKKSLVLGG